jgi:polygalacturonase
MMKALFASFALSITISVQAGQIFNVRNFGATGDGHTYDTTAIQKALDACGVAGGIVEFPAGVYLSQPIILHSKTTFQLDMGAKLLATTNQSDFMKVPGD